MVKNTEINLSTLAKDLKKAAGDAVVIGVGQGPDGPVLVTALPAGHADLARR